MKAVYSCLNPSSPPESSIAMTLSLLESPETIFFQPASRLMTVDNTISLGKYYVLLKGSIAQAQSAIVEAGLTVKIVPPSNKGAPFFADGLSELKLKAGETLVYKMPEILDPDGDESKIRYINIVEVLKFATLDMSTQKIKFKPQEIDVKNDPYVVEITL